MIQKLHKILPVLLGVAFFTTACDDDNSFIPTITDEPSVLVVNQGLMGSLPGTLDLLSLTDGSYSAAICEIEGTPENAVECGGYLFIPQNEKNAVAVFDKSSLRRAATIAVPAPQSVCTDGNRVFAIGGDSIFRINPAALSVELKDTVGHTAFASVCVDGAVYVAIGRGWGQYDGGEFVAKVNPQTLEREYIKVGVNPYNQMAFDDKGNVFVTCSGNYADIPAAVYKIATDGSVSQVCEGGSAIDVANGTLYVITRTSSYDEKWNELSSCTFKTYNTATGTLQNEDFLVGDERPAAATFVKINPNDGDIYIGASGLTEGGFVSYTSAGNVYRYTSGGEFVAKYNAGVSPYTCVFVTRRVAE